MKTEIALPIDIHDKKLHLELSDVSWEKKGDEPYEERLIARAVIVSATKMIFAHIDRADQFGRLSYYETSGGGVRKGETLREGLLRELEEEMGFKGEIICELGEAVDFYNLINRKNLNHYFLVRPLQELNSVHLEKDEAEDFHLQRTEVTFEEALKVYEANKETQLGRLLYQREVPFIELGKLVIDSYGLM